MADSPMLTLSMLEPDVAAITIDDPAKGANILSSHVLDEFDRILTGLEGRSDLAGLVIRSTKPGIFIAGADLREFVAWIDSPAAEVAAFCRRGQTLFGRLAKCPFVTIAAIDGICVGGGAELAIWCDRRIVANNPKTQFGFPEVKLGLMPGWGGTARTPRIVGLSNALELITGGESIGAAAAYKLGLASDLVPSDALEAAAIRLVRAEQKSRAYLADRELWRAPIDMDETELTFLGATASAYIQQQTAGHYPAPLAILELMLSAAGADAEGALELEAEAFPQLFGTPVNRALLNVFFLQDANKKDPGVTTKGVEPRPIKSVSVLGAGIMGQGIAAANVKRKLLTTLSDVVPEAVSRGVSKVLEEVSYDKESKGPDVRRALEFAPLINGSLADIEVAASDLVIEAVIENADIKRQVYNRLEPLLQPEAILASNTSTIPISRLAAGLNYPERFCGLHFFNPVRKMPLVEVIRGERTSDETVATLVAYAKAIGKSPIVVGDGPGFLVNRVLLPYMTEAVELLVEGASIKQVERAAKAFGMPMGPITLFDVVGIDTAVHAGKVMMAAFPDRVVASELLVALFKAGRLGQKSGSGFFNYQNPKGQGESDPVVEQMIVERQRSPRKLSPEEITLRLFLPVLLEATRIVDEGLVRNVRDVDLALIYGIGFPPFKGGLFFWADTLGASKILELLAPFQPLGKRYHATDMLQRLATDGGKFYGK